MFGIIANPASGKDVRRLVARASVFDNQEKQAIVGRALLGIQAAGGTANGIAYLDDAHGITRNAIEQSGCQLDAQPVSAARTASVLDTTTAARALREAGCRVVLTLGGDGTNRAVATAWRDAPLIAISTGTNNVFPSMIEATVAGAAAGAIAAGHVALAEVAAQNKLIHVELDDGRSAIALIDVALSAERFVGSRALLEPAALRAVLLTRADPAAVGMTALGGLLTPLSDAQDAGQLLYMGPGGCILNVPLAPGYYRPVAVAESTAVAFGTVVVLSGPGVLAFDGERELELKPGQRVELRVDRSGPHVVDVGRTLQLAAARGAFRLDDASGSATGPTRLHG
jgi:predicted polyphosphate/ATP-dependent NAD kinase